MSKAFSPSLEILKQNTNIQSLRLIKQIQCISKIRFVGSQIIQALMANVPFVHNYSGEQHSKLNSIVIVHSTGLCELRNWQRIQRQPENCTYCIQSTCFQLQACRSDGTNVTSTTDNKFLEPRTKVQPHKNTLTIIKSNGNTLQ